MLAFFRLLEYSSILAYIFVIVHHFYVRQMVDGEAEGLLELILSNFIQSITHEFCFWGYIYLKKTS